MQRITLLDNQNNGQICIIHVSMKEFDRLKSCLIVFQIAGDEWYMRVASPPHP